MFCRGIKNWYYLSLNMLGIRAILKWVIRVFNGGEEEDLREVWGRGWQDYWAIGWVRGKMVIKFGCFHCFISFPLPNKY
jgi:hypothetical protein